MSHVYLTLAVLPTDTFKQDKNSSDLDDHLNHVKGAWNNFIKDSSGDYELHGSAHWDKPVTINTSGDACDALADARQEVSSNYSSLAESYDAVLVADSETYSPYSGCAPGAFAGDNDDDGDGTYMNVAFVSATNSSGVSTQEVGHLFSAAHEDHDLWGVSEFTVMGNDGDQQCSGGTTPNWRYRRNSFNSCAITQIRDWIDDNDQKL